MKHFYLLLLCTSIVFTTNAQGIIQNSIVDSVKMSRYEWQSLQQIANEQKRFDFADGVGDRFLNIDDDKLRSKAISKAVFSRVDDFKYYVLNNFDDFETKRGFLSTLIIQLKKANRSIDDGSLNVNYYKRLFNHSLGLAKAIKSNSGAYFIKTHVSKELYALSDMLREFPELRQALLEETANHYPEILISKLRKISPTSLADKIVKETAKSRPKLLLNYATSTAIERDIVRRSSDKLVKSLIVIADSSKTPLKAIYFLNDFHSKKKTIEQIDAITESRNAYFKNLVKQLDETKDKNIKTRIGKELHVETKYYVQQMNELHFESAAKRFKSISSFSSSELYYIITEGDEEFYTSSYTGAFKRFVGKLEPKNGYLFLEKIDFNKFRTFIRLCGNFNTLMPFVKTMKDEQKEKLMKMFVSDLDRGDLEQSLEGAIDVATTYSSIRDSALHNLVIEEVQRNKNKAHLADNKLSYRIYNILNILFTADDSTVSAKLNVPPISSLPIKDLRNDSGVVIQQIFFPGDKDGKGVFNSFKRRHTNSKWTFSQTDDWIVYESKGKNKVVKYANKPFDEPKDEFAQKALQKHLQENNLRPSIIIQRGHSYHVATTLDQLAPSNKVIMLGACGGFNHLETIMSKSPDAQIISSKQVGSGSVNWPILEYMDKKLLAGQSLDWVEMWSDLGKRLRSNALFKDYVPPHRNLGSLFLKAFYRAELEEGE